MTLTVAEWVLPGHPDKICDAVADRIVGEALRTDSMAQCGVEVACAFHHIFVTGLVGSMQDGWPELAALMPGWIRSTYRDAGYGDPWNPEPGALRIDLEALLACARSVQETLGRPLGSHTLLAGAVRW